MIYISKRNIMEFFIVFISSVSIIFSIFLIINTYLKKQEIRYTENLGIQAVRLMYEFKDVTDLKSQMNALKKITSDNVFKELDISYDKRVIPIYFKFKAEPTDVFIISSSSTSVCYRLENPNIDEERTFLFRFKVVKNKIISYEEYELITSIDNYGGLIYD